MIIDNDIKPNLGGHDSNCALINATNQKKKKIPNEFANEKLKSTLEKIDLIVSLILLCIIITSLLLTMTINIIFENSNLNSTIFFSVLVIFFGSLDMAFLINSKKRVLEKINVYGNQVKLFTKPVIFYPLHITIVKRKVISVSKQNFDKYKIRQSLFKQKYLVINNSYNEEQKFFCPSNNILMR